MRRITRCPSCGSAKIAKICGKWKGEYRGRVYAVDRLEFYRCPDCGERVYDREAMRKIEAASPAFTKAAAPEKK